MTSHQNLCEPHLIAPSLCGYKQKANLEKINAYAEGHKLRDLAIMAMLMTGSLLQPDRMKLS